MNLIQPIYFKDKKNVNHMNLIQPIYLFFRLNMFF
jgi:hypothetical protein